MLKKCCKSDPCSKKTKTCCQGRYEGPDIDCLGISQGDSLDIVVKNISEYVCENFLQDGVGISDITDNGDGTITINLTDGTSFTSSDLTGPQGEPGDDAACDCCNFNVDIDFVEYAGIGGNSPSFNYTATGGTPPYTVQWSLPDLTQMYTISGSSTSNTVTVVEAESISTVDACGNTTEGSYRTTLLKVVVTDANGCKAKDFFKVSRLFCPS